MLTLLSIDCKMKIYIDKNLFFDDWICPLELYYQLKKWEMKIKDNVMNDFNYNSMETSYNPVISFNYNIETQKWKIDGEYKLYEEVREFDIEELLLIFTDLESELRSHINE